MFHIVLVEPRIPQNTGSIGRMCFNAGFALHIVNPLFSIDEKAVKRAGLDYWKKLNPFLWDNLEDFLKEYEKFQDRFFFATTKTTQAYFDVNYQKGDFLFFGSESFGLPMDLMQKKWENAITIPMKDCGRSLNLATSVGIVSYEALRQNFASFEKF
ncbi:tRNA (cytidine(34)-2'-O)-methyltransferase [Campylobacter sp. CNRCH_2013_0671h]|uniref:tRNA (cytidine(34)-2'-O)-methyltransferase n=1 Tax=unclassified Campylobacter TaxID=2593542 RepID=UPI0021E64A67|nr:MULTISPECIES: tRNA (cytidine(34)-2'-O)-methyltransferase [unclassified Campylobacter]MCV3425536.1 tRNA (cytidine(34)-2'-O)-methyltransferase [Campylobacter sp. IFREMER_LSEM_CL1085]MCV3547905.1 tRNA (cytidine(34)-2'-O)-methyltransferase [Campylobacter sp. CNRCH_2013_0671h]HEC1756435.1 tRNA (cytidine(34)-2'-O)-methyltransferase [Campylobacter lari]